MYLRKLELKDAPLMLEWMHDKDVTEYLHSDFASKTIEDAERFIHFSWDDPNNVNLAISSDKDEYMGTVSLKNIEKGSAEFAITVRAEAMGHGYSWFGMKSILEKAFNEYGLECVYWCVLDDNNRAISFYNKHNFRETSSIPKEAFLRYEGVENLKWYSVQNVFFNSEREFLPGCEAIRINTISTNTSGELSFFESLRDIPFEIKRIYYITKVPVGVKRGFHAHKELKQFLFCPYGRIQLVLENEYGRKEIELSDSSLGVLINQCTWREMKWLQKDSILCVAASDYYKEEDYIRDYQEFLSFIGG